MDGRMGILEEGFGLPKKRKQTEVKAPLSEPEEASVSQLSSKQGQDGL